MGILLDALDLMMRGDQSPKQRADVVAAILDNQLLNFFDGYMVITPSKKGIGFGCIGLAEHRPEHGQNAYYVQHGASGPITFWHAANLRYASYAEIKEAGLLGVGCKTPPL